MDDLLAEALGLREPDTPFPWQRDLYARFCSGALPPALDLPTGFGKTKVMALWLLARARGAPVPRRLVYVVDRRTVVDQATEEAERLRVFVRHHPALREGLGLLPGRDLPVSALRGALLDNRQWLSDPASAAIVVGTVDMVGSRLLFQGYRVRPLMRSYHAGLMGCDALLVLDEAHLVPAFEALLRTLADPVTLWGPVAGTDPPVPPLQLLTLSATGRNLPAGCLRLTEADLAHPIARQRWRATKRLVVRVVPSRPALAEALARAAWELAAAATAPVRCVVFCHQPETARRAEEALKEVAGTSAVDTLLLVGERRVREREGVRDALQRLGFVGGAGRPARHAFLFATSAGEVGVDLDADHAVCDLVPWDRLVQRLGRVNRRGRGAARVLLLVEREPVRTQGAESSAEELAPERAVSTLLEELGQDGDGVDVSPEALADLVRRAETDPRLAKLLRAATTPEPLRPALSRALVEAWALTTLHGPTLQPAPDPWLRGWVAAEPQTAVLWRRLLPESPRGGADVGEPPARERDGRSDGLPGVPADREVEGFFEAAAPHPSELLEAGSARVAEWLAARAATVREAQDRDRPRDAADVPSSAATDATSPVTAAPGDGLSADSVVAWVLAPDDAVYGLRLRELAAAHGRSGRRQRDALTQRLAHATLIVDARLGGLREGLLAHDAEECPATADQDPDWLDTAGIPFRVRSLTTTGGEGPPVALVTGAGPAGPPAGTAGWHQAYRMAQGASSEEEPTDWLVVERRNGEPAGEEERATGPRLQELDAHQGAVVQCVRSLAQRLGLSQAHAAMLEAAAAVHDVGKQARRWQLAFHAPPGPEGQVYAKTPGPVNHALLDGYRHELGSLLWVQADPRRLPVPEPLRDLALHLIAAHHGRARPTIETSGCEDLPPSRLEDVAADIARRYARLQAQWGPWLLAWWEALLRAADQQASAGLIPSADTGWALETEPSGGAAVMEGVC